MTDAITTFEDRDPHMAATLASYARDYELECRAASADEQADEYDDLLGMLDEAGLSFLATTRV